MCSSRSTGSGKFCGPFLKKKFFGLYLAFIRRTAEEMTGNRVRERGGHMQQRVAGQHSNPGLLQRGQSLGLGRRAAHWAKQRGLFNLWFQHSSQQIRLDAWHPEIQGSSFYQQVKLSLLLPCFSGLDGPSVVFSFSQELWTTKSASLLDNSILSPSVNFRNA